MGSVRPMPRTGNTGSSGGIEAENCDTYTGRPRDIQSLRLTTLSADPTTAAEFLCAACGNNPLDKP